MHMSDIWGKFVVKSLRNSKAKQMEVILWNVLLGLAILVTALAVSLYYRRKYDPLLHELSELLSDREAGKTNKTTEKPDKIANKETEKEVKAVEGIDEEEYKRLTNAILNEQLYTVPKFGRKELVERFHLSSKRVSSAFSSAGTSVPEFIRKCRLEHARQLMVERPEMTLSEIAAASGFVHASTFTVDFKNKYGVSPTIYREKELRAKSNSEK